MTKEISVSKILVAFIITFMMGAVLSISHAIPLYLKVTGNDVNMRSGPSTSYDVVSSVSSSTTKYTISSYKRGESDKMWYKVTINKKTGYIVEDYIQVYAKQGQITGDSVNVRTGAGTSYDYITTVNKGEKYIILTSKKDSNNSTWYKIRVGNNVGYIKGTYISIKYISGSKKPRLAIDLEDQTSYVNIRSGPSTSKSSIKKAYIGEVYYILDDSNSSWYKIQVSSGKVGYVQKSYAKELGKSFTSVDISAQKLYFYIDNIKILECNVVTGVQTDSTNKLYKTNKGVFSVLAKERQASLSGTNADGTEYESNVDYWICYDGNSYGIHDASWRSEFGGTIYKENGSHGCVNTPIDVVKELYSMCRPSDPVVIHQ